MSGLAQLGPLNQKGIRWVFGVAALKLDGGIGDGNSPVSREKTKVHSVLYMCI
jgi:hypothetical protein